MFTAATKADLKAMDRRAGGASVLCANWKEADGASQDGRSAILADLDRGFISREGRGSNLESSSEACATACPPHARGTLGCPAGSALAKRSAKRRLRVREWYAYRPEPSIARRHRGGDRCRGIVGKLPPACSERTTPRKEGPDPADSYQRANRAFAAGSTA